MNKKYGAAVAHEIVEFIGTNFSGRENPPFILREDGIYLSPSYRYNSFTGEGDDWSQVHEMEGPNAPNPLTALVLPIPFTAEQLGAFVVDGVGAIIADLLGCRIGDLLNEQALDKYFKHARFREVREVLQCAFEKLAKAQAVVGKYDEKWDERAETARRQYIEANMLGNKTDGVFESGISRGEAEQRRARVAASVAELRKLSQQVMDEAEKAWSAWRKAMVLQLEVESQAATQVPMGQSVKPRTAPAKWPWVKLAQEEANLIIKRLHARDLYPTQEDIADEIARNFRERGIHGASGKPLSARTIKRHALKGISSAFGKAKSTSIGRSKQSKMNRSNNLLCES